MATATALALLITGCAQQDAINQNKPAAAAPKETITHHFFVSGQLGRRKLSMQPKFKRRRRNGEQNRNPATFVNGLLVFITLGIYIC